MPSADRATIGPRLVIADDNRDMRRLVRAVFRDRFSRVTEVGDGRALFWELVRASYQGDTDVVAVIDVVMPTYTGLEVLDALGELDYHVPIIVITSFPSPGVRDRVHELGGILIAKPFTVSELRAVIDGLLTS